MKHFLLIIISILTISEAFSQDFMNIITQKSCACLDKIPETANKEEFNMKLGVCMIEAAVPYKKQIKKEYDIDLDKLTSEEGQKLGQLVGIKMATVCPNALVRATQATSGNADQDKEDLVSTGTVTKIENDSFVIFSIKDETGKITKYYWLTFIESEGDLTSTYSTIAGKSVSINYESIEFFDPKLLEYRQFLVIKKLTLLN